MPRRIGIVESPTGIGVRYDERSDLEAVQTDGTYEDAGWLFDALRVKFVDTPTYIDEMGMPQDTLGMSGEAGPLFYVAAGGDDEADGTSPETAWATLDKVAEETFPAGSTVLLEAGETFVGYLFPTQGLSFGSYGIGRAIIDWRTIGFGIYGYGTGSHRFQNLILMGDTSGPAVFFESEAAQVSGLTFRNISVDAGTFGIAIEGANGFGYDDVLIDNCQVDGVTQEGIIAYGDAGAGAQNHANVRVTGNTVSDCGFSGVLLGNVDIGEIYDNLITGCGALQDNASTGPVAAWCYDSNFIRIHGNRAIGNTTGAIDGGAYDIDGGCVGCVIEGNYSQDNDGPGMMAYAYTDGAAVTGAVIRFNLSVNDGLGYGKGALLLGSGGPAVSVDVYNNTFYLSDDSGHFIDVTLDDGAVTGDIRNNIFSGPGGADFAISGEEAPALTFAGNAWHGPGGFDWDGIEFATLALWGEDDDGIVEDPMLVDPESDTPEGLAVRPGSPVRGAGVPIENNGGIDYFGDILPNRFDIGAIIAGGPS